MASPRDLRRRIKSIRGTAQITKAMQMVAASKMRRAQQAALSAVPFASRLYRIQRSATTSTSDFRHPLVEERPVRRRAVVVVSADKGLCGPLNTNVLRLAAKYDPETTVYLTAGRKAAQFVARSKRKLEAEFSYSDTPTFGEAKTIAVAARDLFLNGTVDEVHIVATRFVNRTAKAPGGFQRTKSVGLGAAPAVTTPTRFRYLATITVGATSVPVDFEVLVTP